MSTLAEDYLQGYGGSPERYRNGLARDLHMGTAFHLALSEEDRELLRTSKWSLSQIEHGPMLIKVIEWLLDQK